MARPRTRFLSVLLISAAAGICTWLALPSSPVDRAFMEVVARSSANPPFIISGKGSHTEPWALQVISPHSKAASRNAPLIISLADDPDHIFQESPPSPVDLAIILKNIRRLGASRAAISAILAWEKPDVIALSALDSQLAAFSAIATAAPLSRSPNTTALPPSFRRASLPLDQIRGDTSVLPAVNRISLPDIILGGDSAISGFSILEQDDNDNTPLIARWDERAVFAFPLVAVMAQRGLSFDGVEIELGKFIRFPHGGPIIPIDEFGRLSATLGKASARDTVRADALIDGDAAFPPDSFALLRDDQSAAEAGTRAFSRKVDPLIEAISAGAGMAAVREFRRMSATAECIILLGIATLLAGFTPLDRFSRQLAFGISAAVLLIIHFVAASTASVWLPTLPAIAAVFSAFIISRFFTGKAAIPVIEIPPPAVVPAKQAEPIAVFTIAREVSKPKPASKKTAREAAPKIPAAKKTTAKKSTAAKKTAAKKTPAAKKAARSRKSPPEIPTMNPIDKADALIEALPYLQAFRGKTFLIKMGGSAMEDPELVANVMRDIVFLEVAGINPIVVHGGGKAISAAMEKAGLEAKFVGGFRVTTDEAIDIVARVLSEELNPGLVRMIRDFGGKAVGIPGNDVFLGEKLRGKDADGKTIDLGRVGEIVGCQLKHMDAAYAGIVPVISPLASELATGRPLNINADLAAAALAKELRAAKLVYLSDVPGLLSDPKNPASLIKSVTRRDADQLIADGTISGGMIPKIRSAVDALNAGVRKVHFIDGRQPHSLLLEIFTDGGVGTEVIR